jgi:hypothetical protein
LIYTGYWENNKMHGHGELIEPGHEAKYTGDFIKGKREGYGVSFADYGSKWHRGFWKNNMKHGEGYVRGELEV